MCFCELTCLLTPVTKLKHYDLFLVKQGILIYHIIYKSSNRNKVHDTFGITYFEKLITMQIRSRD